MESGAIGELRTIVSPELLRLEKMEDIMAEKGRETLRQEVIDHPKGAEMNGTGPSAAQSFAERFDPFHDRGPLPLLVAWDA